MNATLLRICSVLALCMLFACSPGKNQKQQETTQEDDAVTEPFGSYASLASSHVIAYQDSLLFFYNVDEDMVVPFHLQEPDEVFSFTFDPDGKHMYYTVVRKGKLTLRQATFTDGAPKLEDLADLGLDKEDCIHQCTGENSSLVYRKGKLAFQSGFSWDGYGFSKTHIFTLASRTLQKDVGSDTTEQFFAGYKQETGEDKFVTKSEQLYYRSGKQLICVSNKLKLQEKREEDPVEYMWSQVSPDGSKVAFIAVTMIVDLPHGPLCIANADGSNQRLLAEDAAANELPPLWVGNKLYFIDQDSELEAENDGDCTTSLYVTDPTTNERSRMFDRVRRFAIKLPAK